jgi:hypothetical protein
MLLLAVLDVGAMADDDAYARLDAWARARGIEPVGERTEKVPRRADGGADPG